MKFRVPFFSNLLGLMWVVSLGCLVITVGVMGIKLAITHTTAAETRHNVAKPSLFAPLETSVFGLGAYEFTDPANGERFIVVVIDGHIAIAPAHAPIPNPSLNHFTTY